jgi:hypothetical protein
MNTFDQEITAIVAAMSDELLAGRIAESRTALTGHDGMQSLVAGLCLPLLEAEQQRRQALTA